MSGNFNMSGRTKLYKNFYLCGDLPEQKIDRLLQIHNAGSVPQLKHIVDGYELHEPQTVAVAMAFINPRFFIADRMGLGKSLMAAAVRTFLRKEVIKRYPNNWHEVLRKQLIVTKTSNVLPMVRMYNKYGLQLYPIYGTRAKTQIKHLDLNDPDIDGVVIPWSGFTSHATLSFISDNLSHFDFAVYDETDKLVKEGSQTYAMASSISASMKRVIFTYGTPWQKSVMDFFYQFKVLNPTVMPVKKFLLDNYAIMEDDSFWRTQLVNTGGGYEYKRTQRTFRKIGGYVNQPELKDRLTLHFLARSKQDYSEHLPKHTYTAVPVEMSDTQRKYVDDYHEKAVFLNSPTTCNPDFNFNEKNVPKLDKLLDLVEEIKEDRPVIYCHNVNAQYVIKEHLTKKGHKVEIINGRIPEIQRDAILDAFDNFKIDILILNIYDALNIPNSDAMIFYTIPTMPHIAYQTMGRIDRNNYTKIKSYYFLIYMESIEVQRLHDICLFREHNANEFTGSQDEVFAQLYAQVQAYESPELEFEFEDDLAYEEGA